MMLQQLKNYAYYDESTRQYYASNLWTQLIEKIDPEKSRKFLSEFNNKIPLDVMVKYTQDKFLRKREQRWILENYNDFDPAVKEQLQSLLTDYGQLDAQPIPDKADFVLFLGSSTANLCKRAFFLYDAIVKENKKINAVIVLGNSEPYDNYLDTLQKIISLYPTYFCHGLLPKDVPLKATMHETMMFILDHLNWSEGTKPSLVELCLNHPCNTHDEVIAVLNYLPGAIEQPNARRIGLFSSAAPAKKIVVALSHQPFNDRQGITTLGAFLKSNQGAQFTINAAGPGLETYHLLNALPASTTSSAQIIDNLTRTLYEISQNSQLLLCPTSTDVNEYSLSSI